MSLQELREAVVTKMFPSQTSGQCSIEQPSELSVQYQHGCLEQHMMLQLRVCCIWHAFVSPCVCAQL